MKLLQLAALSSIVLAHQAIATPTGNGGDNAKVEAKVEFVSPITAEKKRDLDFGTMLTSWSTGSIEVIVADSSGTTTRTVGADPDGDPVNVFNNDFTSGHVEISGFTTGNTGTSITGVQVAVSGTAVTNTSNVLTLDMGQGTTFTNTLSCTDSLSKYTDHNTCGLLQFTDTDIAGATSIDLYFGGELTRGTGDIAPQVYTGEFDVTASYY